MSYSSVGQYLFDRMFHESELRLRDVLDRTPIAWRLPYAHEDAPLFDLREQEMSEGVQLPTRVYREQCCWPRGK